VNLKGGGDVAMLFGLRGSRRASGLEFIRLRRIAEGSRSKELRPHPQMP